MTAFLALLAFSSAALPAEAPHVRVGVDNADKCTTTWNGEQVDIDTLLIRAQALPNKKKTRVSIEGDATVPYRCVGGAIYTLQRAGFLDIGFIAEPPAKDSQ